MSFWQTLSGVFSGAVSPGSQVSPLSRHSLFFGVGDIFMRLFFSKHVQRPRLHSQSRSARHLVELKCDHVTATHQNQGHHKMLC